MKLSSSKPSSAKPSSAKLSSAEWYSDKQTGGHEPAGGPSFRPGGPVARRALRPPQPWLLGATAAAALFLAATSARAEAITAAAGCTANVLPRGNDVVSGAVDLGFEVEFGDSSYSQIYVDTNGAVRFTNDTLAFDTLRGASWASPPSHAVPFIAPFHADVDTSGPTSKAVTYGPITADGRKALCINWVDVEHRGGVGSPAGAASRNSFQLVLVKRDEEGGFDIVFNYSRLEWDDDAHPAFVGYFDGKNQIELPGSRTSRTLLDVSSSGLVYGQRGGDEIGQYVLPVVEAPPQPLVRAKLSGDAFGPNGAPLGGAAVRACDPQGLCVAGVTNGLGGYSLQGFEGADVADVWRVELAPPAGSAVEAPPAIPFSFPSGEPPIATVVAAMFSPPGCVETSHVPIMTEPTEPSGIATSSGVYDSNYEAWQTFDSSKDTGWISKLEQTPAWVAYEWPSGTHFISRYAIHFTNGALTSRAPLDWTLQGWNGSVWSVVDTRNGETNWGGSERREYTVTSPGWYKGYRLHVTDDNDARAGVVVISIGRFQLLGCASNLPRRALPLALGGRHDLATADSRARPAGRRAARALGGLPPRGDAAARPPLSARRGRQRAPRGTVGLFDSCEECDRCRPSRGEAAVALPGA
jgi:hypothetical protein